MNFYVCELLAFWVFFKLEFATLYVDYKIFIAHFYLKKQNKVSFYKTNSFIKNQNF